MSKETEGKINAWTMMEKFFETDPRIQPIYQEVKQQCLRDQIYGVSTVYIATIQELLDRQCDC